VITPSIVFGSGTGKIVFNHTDTGYLFAPSVLGAVRCNWRPAPASLPEPAPTVAGRRSGAGSPLQLGNGGATGSITGNVLNNATLAFDRSNTYGFGGVISGSGVLQQNGTGKLILSAVNSYTGATMVTGGTLDVEGSITASSLTSVGANATLTGGGTVGKTTIANGGAFLPGTPTPGSFMTVAGDLALQSGAAYLVQITPNAASDARVSGRAALNGMVTATYSSGNLDKHYTILSAAHGITGRFSGLANTNLPSNFSTSLSYDATHAYLDLSLSFTPSGSGPGLTGNNRPLPRC